VTTMRIVLPLLLLLPAAAGAQVRASEEATVSQTVDGTTITVDYSRPVARGRTGIFGKAVRLQNHTWTPGANTATRLRVSKDVTIEKVAVPKGRYSVWIALADGPWELVLDPDTMRFHTQPPRRRAGQVRIPLARERRPFLEVLTFSFPEVRATGTTMLFQWDTVAVPMRIEVQSSFSRAVSAASAQPLVGRYQLKFEPRPASMRDTTTDTTAASGAEEPPSAVMVTVRHEGGELRATMDPPLFASEPGYRDWVLLPSRGTWFTPARLLDGQLVELMDYFRFQFVVADGRASAMEVRLPNDRLIGKATRLP
jgi:hypothetical protein